MKGAVISPSKYISKKDKKIIDQNMKELGFEEIFYFLSEKPLFNRWAGSESERLSLFYESFKSPTKVVIAARGGSGIFHFLFDINFSKIKNKKPILGYSDFTPMLSMYYQETGLISFHGPMPLKKIDVKSIKALQDALAMRSFGINFTKNKILNKPKKTIKGVIVGGNLERITELINRYPLNMENKIIFLEDTEIIKYRAFNLLTALSKYKNFKPKALLLGNMGFPYDKSFEEMLKYIFPNIPIITNLPFGHSLPNITIPIGANCSVDFNSKKILFTFPKKLKKYAVNLI